MSYEYVVERFPGTRRTGKSTALASLACRIRAAFVVDSEQSKRMWKRRYPRLDVRVAGENWIRGYRGKMVFDHRVYELIIDDLMNRLRRR